MLILLFLAVLAGGLFYLTRPARLAHHTGDLLTQLTGANVRIGDARIHFDGSIELHDVDFSVPSPHGPPQQLFEAQVVLIRQHLASLLRGKFNAQSITFIQPTLYLTEDLDHGIFNYQLLQDQRKKEKDKPKRLPDSLPEIFIRQGVIQYGEIDQQQYTPLGSLHLSGGLTTVAGSPHVYAYQLRQDASQADSDQPQLQSGSPTLWGQFNLTNLAVTAKLDRFALQGSHRQLLPRKLRQWWDQLDPVGSLPDVQFGYDPAMGMHAVLQVKDVALTLPYSDPPVRMKEVSGKFTIVGETIAITQLKGTLEDVQYEINGQIDGLDNDAPFNMTARIARFTIPAEPHYLLALPRVVQKQFQRFAPSGEFAALVSIRRPAPHAEILYDGQVEVLNAKGIYAKFPYPVTDVRGVLRFNNEELRIVSLHANAPKGGRVTITGVIAPPRDDAMVDIHVSGTDIAIDHNLFAAMEDDEQEVVRNFFHQPAVDRLQKLGLLQSSELKTSIQQQIDTLKDQRRRLLETDPAIAAINDELAKLEKQLIIPVFDMGGRVDLKVHLTREFGPDKRYLPTTTIDVSRVSAITEPWNYPLRVTGGRVIISPGLATLDNLKVEGLDGLDALVTGKVDLPRKSVPGSKSQPDVHVQGKDLPVGPLLLASLPDAQAAWLKQLNITGKLTLVGKVFRSGTEPMDFDILTHLTDASLQPFDGRIAITPMSSIILIHRRSAEILEIAGKIKDAAISGSGLASWKDKQTHLALELAGKNLDFTWPMLDLVPSKGEEVERVRRELDVYQPAGRYDAKVSLNIQGKNDPVYEVKLWPQSLSFNYNDARPSFDTAKGEVTITREKILLDDCQFTFDDKRATASIDGQVTLGESPIATVTFAAKNKRLDPTSMALMPKGAAAAVKGMAVATGYELSNSQLIYRWREPERVAFKGDVKLIDAKADIGLAIDELQGVLKVEATQAAAAPWPQLKLSLQADRLRAAKRMVSPLAFEVLTADAAQPELLVIPQIRGKVYQGLIMGQGQFRMGGDQPYSLEMTIQEAMLEGIAEPEKMAGPLSSGTGSAGSGATTTAAPAAMVNAPYATFSARLSLQGNVGQSEQRQGRGMLDVRNANLYQTPIGMTLLQILTLSWPSAKSFDRAQASFVIDGNTARLDPIRFETPSLALVGQGTMDIPSQELNLDFVTRRTSGPGFGPLGDLVSVLKDQILDIHVEGTLQQPVTQVKSFSGIGQSWTDVFGSGAEEERRR